MSNLKSGMRVLVLPGIVTLTNTFFPKAARRQGDDPQLIPWQASLIHTGFQQLNTMLDRESNEDLFQPLLPLSSFFLCAGSTLTDH